MNWEVAFLVSGLPTNGKRQ